MNEELQWAYLAGCIDCDGSIIKSEHGGRTRFSIVLTQHVSFKSDIEKLTDFLISQGIEARCYQRITKTNVGVGHMVNMHVGERKSIIKMCEHLFPYIRFKASRLNECF